MRFTVATVLAFAASAIAAIGNDPTRGFDAVNLPNENEVLPAGKPYVVKWEAPAPYTNGEIFIQLLGGKDQGTLQVKNEKLVTLNNNALQYTWDVDASLGDDPVYGLKFVWGADNSIVQFSKQFHIKKAEGSGSSTVTMTSSQGVKTITLSSATTTTTTTTSSTTTEVTTSSAAPNTTVARNSTSTTVTRTTSLVSSTAATSTTPTTIAKSSPSSAAAHVAGSVAALGGIVAALLAL